MADPASLIASWLTPSSLFIFVNLVIGTIAITSRFGATPKNEQLHHQLVRSPSLLQRVRSFSFERATSFKPEPEPEPEQPELVRTPSLLERVTSFNLSFHKHEPAPPETQQVEPEPKCPEGPELVRSPSLLQRIKSMNLSHLYRSDPDSVDPGRGSGKSEMRKSASERGVSMEEEEEEVERRRPATARDETAAFDEEVDMKADDFINRFRKQLRLQRIDSLVRYRDMLRGGR